MQLNDYRKQRGATYTELARLLGASHATVARRWCLPPGSRDRMIPNKTFMGRIMLLSGGQVSPNDFYVVGDDASIDT